LNRLRNCSRSSDEALPHVSGYSCSSIHIVWTASAYLDCMRATWNWIHRIKVEQRIIAIIIMYYFICILVYASYEINMYWWLIGKICIYASHDFLLVVAIFSAFIKKCIIMLMYVFRNKHFIYLQRCFEFLYRLCQGKNKKISSLEFSPQVI
jgi:hypothetical protein